MSSNAEPVGETGQCDFTFPFLQSSPDLSHIFDSLRNFLVSNHIVLTGAHTIKLRVPDEEAILAGTFVVEIEVLPMRPLTLQSPNEMIDSTAGQIESPTPITGVIDNEVCMMDSSEIGGYQPETGFNSATQCSAALNSPWQAIGPSIRYNLPEESNNAGNVSLDMGSMPPVSPSVAGGLENQVDHSTMTVSQPGLNFSQYSPLSCNSQTHSATEAFNLPVSVADATVNRRRGRRSGSVSTTLGCSESSHRTNRQSKLLALTIKSVQQPVIRPDWLTFLEAELPRWALWGLWEGAADVTPPAKGGGHEYHSLQVAYSAVCFLEKRVDYDSIRCRIALVELHREYERACTNRQEIEERRRIGWGVSSSTIDYILKNTHSNWSLLSESQRKSRRSQFHDRKRYGKRWAVLTDGLGTGIVLLSSTNLAKAVHNTSFTSEMLNQFVQHTRGDATTTRILKEVRKVADQLWLGQPCGSYDANFLLNRLKMGSGGDFDVME
ncbi:hypothetical protein BB8028_0006g03240 [Beauveria bassiana]|uniref:Uncharacterized protein n=1 Tax=Beauveria bassiana TaxID=176275 RepID=A0A2S7YJH7_BEABA|nr:hypothetical protein BB8028_0006g03240 [Beauveria bassiana]